MDEATRARVEALLRCPIGQLNVGDALWLAFTLIPLGDDEMGALIGAPVPE